MSKILITGSTGKIAESAVRIFGKETNHELVLLTSTPEKIKSKWKKIKSDPFDKKALKAILFDEKPDIIINTLAMTDVDACETDKKNAWYLNTTYAETLVKACKVMESHLVTFSTDYIFDGIRGPYTETDKPNPVSYYGKTKLAAENICFTEKIRYTVIRTNVVFGFSSYGKMDFVNWVNNNLRGGKQLNIITGQYGNPTFTDDIARGLIKIIEKERYGIYNFAGGGYYNRYEIAKKVATVFGHDQSLISPMDPSTLIQKAKRPEKGGLINLKAETDLNIKFSEFESALHNLKFQIDTF